MNNPRRVISGSAGLAGFAIAIVAGLSAENSASVVLANALVSLAACATLGSILGAITESMVRAHVQRYKAANPLRAAASAPEGTTPEETKAAAA